MHVNCVAHLLHNCTMLVHAHFKNIDKVITTIKVTVTKITRKIFLMLACHLLLTLQLQDGQLGAALNYSENIPAVCSITNNCTSAGLLVNQPQDAIIVEDLMSDIVKINHQY